MINCIHTMSINTINHNKASYRCLKENISSASEAQLPYLAESDSVTILLCINCFSRLLQLFFNLFLIHLFFYKL